MFLIRLLCCFFLCCCLPFWSVAQNAIVSIDLINEDDGMRNSNVRDILVDSRGLIWMATPNGLHRYDGYSFAVYDNGKDSPATLTSYDIYSIEEDKNGNIWIGTANGINVLNPSTQSILSYYNEGNVKYPPIETNEQSCKLVTDSHGDIWFLFGGKIGFYNESTGFKFPFLDDLPLLVDIDIDGKDNIFLSDPNIGESYHINRKREVNKLAFRTIIQNREPMNAIGEVLFHGENGQLNFVHFDRNLYTYNAEKDSVERVVVKENSLNDVVQKLIKGEMNLNIPTINYGRDNIIYKLLTVAKGQDDLYWIGTNLGLLKISIVQTAFYSEDQLKQKSIRSLYEDQNGDIYIAGYKPFNFKRYNSATKKLDGNFDLSNIWNVASLNPDTLILIIGGYSQISYFDIPSQKVVKLFDCHQIARNLRGIVILPNDKFIVGSQIGGLFTTSVSSLDSLAPLKLKHNDSPLDGAKVNCLYKESNNIFWAGSTNKIVEVNLEKGTATTHPIVDAGKINNGQKEVFDIYMDGDEKLWLATTNGLVYYDPITKKNKIYTTVNGLSDDLVYSILPQDSTALWLATNNGLSKLNISQQEFYTYTESDGISFREFNRNSALITKDGKFYFGGLNGFTSFYPSEVGTNEVNFEPFISSYSVYNRAKDKLIEYVTDRENGQEIHLDPDNRNITFTLALTDYRNPFKASFSVMLEGFDNKWIHNRNNREVRYTNLPAGKYTFKVRATNSYGQTSEQEDFVRLIVRTPWYTSFWFYGAIVLLVFASIIAVYLSKLNYERKTNKLRNRIANDLHDEVSNTLNNIRIVALDNKRENKQTNNEDLGKIETMSTYAIDHLQDVIWAIDLENQDMKYLLFRMEDNIDSLLRDRNIPVKVNKINFDELATLDFLHRRNLLLIFKEALSNIVKHTLSSKVEITIGNVENNFTLSVKNYIIKRLDAPYKTGRGTISMTQRAMALNGELKIIDAVESYEVLLKLKNRL